jgi:energy-coupling factor transporter ATP-binding protein EcfA2
VRAAKVTIEGFRSIKGTAARLGAFQALIGPNSCGKSNFLRALEFFFESRSSITLEDFCQDSAGNSADRIVVELTFDTLRPTELSKFSKYVLGDGSIRVQKIAKLENGSITSVEYHGVRRLPKELKYRPEAYQGAPSVRFSALSTALGPVDQFRPEGRVSDSLFEQTLEALVKARMDTIEFEDAIEATQFLGLKQVAASTLGRFLLLQAIPDPSSEADVRNGSRLSELVSVVLEKVTEGSPTVSSLNSPHSSSRNYQHTRDAPGGDSA